MTKNNYKYKFSVVIPVYNVENYLEETIESVIKQNIGFKKNIQIILVNDGSPDNSERICLKYQEKYPNNIIYIKQKNAGVSSARNNGLEHAEGEFINFLDSDDKWEKDVFKKALKMFEEHNEIDVIGVRQKYFEASNNYPSLDFKFDHDKVVDIFENYDHIQLSVTSAFIRSSAIGDIRFDTRVKYSEDAKFLFEIIFKQCKLGIIASSLHLYRKRLSENSAIQTKNANDDWYLVTPELCYKYVYNLSKEKFGRVIEYAQYYVAYDYQWRSRERIPDNISEDTRKKYMKTTKELFSEINNKIIMMQKNISSEYKIMYLNMINKKDVREDFNFLDNKITYCGEPIINLQNKNIINLTTINTNKNEINIIGTVNLFLDSKDYDVYIVKNNTEKIKLSLEDTPVHIRNFFNEPFTHNKGFDVTIKTNDLKSLHFEIVYQKKHVVKANFITNIWAKIDLRTKIYYISNNKIFYCQRNQIKCRPNNIINRTVLKLRALLYKILKLKLKHICYRIMYSFLKMFTKEKIWIISDRPYTANDNGFAFYKYVNSIKHNGIKPYFVIASDSEDLDKVKSVGGEYLIYNSLKYKLYFLLADKIVSSQADPWVTNPFGKSHRFYHDLYNADFVFLQHGITKDDLSSWLNKYSKNISLFITSAQKEYDSIINNKKYGYGKDVVKLTGFARYDLLENKSEKIIAIMPTWRSKICGPIDSLTGKRTRNPLFKKSEYFKFYNNLINDERLIKKMKENGYKGIFVNHPSHIGNIDDYKDNDTIVVEKNNVEYSNIFSKASLLISDYSSVVFDFAYLKKPVIYCRFDEEDFFKTHIYDEGYFNVEKMGFGKVTYDYKSLVDEIIKCIENDCQLEKKYQTRIDDFFTYKDQNNSKRTYEEIIKMDKK